MSDTRTERTTSKHICKTVTTIGDEAFADCGSLTTITYHCTMSQWCALKKGDDWDEGTPDYKVHCTDGALDKDDERNI